MCSLLKLSISFIFKFLTLVEIANTLAACTLPSLTIQEVGEEISSMLLEAHLLDYDSGKPKVVFVGPTRSGKSTLINYLAKISLEVIDQDGEFLLQLASGAKGMKIGHKFSETHIPSCLSVSGVEFYDSPGLEDTGDITKGIANKIAYELINGFLIKTLLSKSPVKFIWVVRKVDLYNSVRSQEFINSITKLIRSMTGFTGFSDSIGIVVTSCEPHIELKHIAGRLRRCLAIVDRVSKSKEVKEYLRYLLESNNIAIFHQPSSLKSVCPNDRVHILDMISSLSFNKIFFTGVPLSLQTESVIVNACRSYIYDILDFDQKQFTIDDDYSSLIALYRSMQIDVVYDKLKNPEDENVKLVTLLYKDKYQKILEHYWQSASSLIMTNCRSLELVIGSKIKRDLTRSLEGIRVQYESLLSKSAGKGVREVNLTSISWLLKDVASSEIKDFLKIVSNNPIYREILTYYENLVSNHKLFLSLKQKGLLQDAQLALERLRSHEAQEEVSRVREARCSIKKPDHTSSSCIPLKLTVSTEIKSCVLI